MTNTPTCMLLFNHHVELSGERFNGFLAEAYPDVKTEVIANEGDESFLVTFGASQFVVMVLPAPVPLSSLDGALKNNKQLPVSTVEQHQSHIIVSPFMLGDGMGRAVHASIVMMMLIDALRKTGELNSMFWSSANVLLDEPGFQNALSGVNTALGKQNAGQPDAAYSFPVQFWVGFELFYRDEDDAWGAISTGFEAYYGAELQITYTQEPIPRVLSFLYGSLSYLLATNAALALGQTLQVGEQDILTVQDVPSDTGRYYILQLG